MGFGGYPYGANVYSGSTAESTGGAEAPAVARARPNTYIVPVESRYFVVPLDPKLYEIPEEGEE